MKRRSCYFLLFILVCPGAEAQEASDEAALRPLGDYRLKGEVGMYPCQFTGCLADSLLMVAEPGSLFTVVKQTDDSVIIRFWEWKDNPALNTRLCFADSLCSRRKYFIVAQKDLQGLVKERRPRNPGFAAGTVIIPFKLRMGTFDFSKDVTLGPTAGIRFRLSHYSNQYCNVLIGVGITSITLDAYNSHATVEESVEVPALTPSLGFVFEPAPSVQAGFFLGADYVAHNESLHFIYHGKPWISIGLGYSLITRNEEPTNNVSKLSP